MQAGADPLRAPLPAEVVAGGRHWFSYRNFHAFSAPWFWRRSLLFATVILLFSGVVALGLGITLRSWWLALNAGAHFAVAFLTMSLVGPGLATLARHARWPLRRERTAVVLSIMLGVAAGYGADAWSSAYLGNMVKPLVSKPGGTVHVVVKRTPEPAVSPRTAANLIVILAIYSMIGGGLALHSYFAEPRRLQLARQLREADELRRRVQDTDLKMAVLQAQVEPHFLFNALASVRSLIRQDPERAERALDALAEHLRATIPRLRADRESLVSTLGQQLEICRSYLELMQVRMGPRLACRFEVEEELLGLPFPPLMLISLVENAIKHGIEPKAGQGQVFVSAAREGEVLSVCVEDDGRGLVAGEGGKGIGLANIREQLRTRYGSRASLAIEARPGGGVAATIRVPLEPAA